MNGRVPARDITLRHRQWNNVNVSILKQQNPGLKHELFYWFIPFLLKFVDSGWTSALCYMNMIHKTTNETIFVVLSLPGCQFPASAAWRKTGWTREERWAAGWQPKDRPKMPDQVLAKHKYNRHCDMYLPRKLVVELWFLKKVYLKLLQGVFN